MISIAPRVPVLFPRFWLLVLNTALMKRRHRATSDDYTAHLHRFYTRTETNHVECYGDAYHAIRPLVVEAARPEPGDTVLDIATGGGYQAAAFAASGCRTVGVDLVADRVAMAAEQHPSPLLSWDVADASRLPFADGSFDIVTISLALHDMPLDIQLAALREMRRVARKRVVIVEPRAPSRGLKRHVYAALGEVLDESTCFHDFALRDFDAHLAEAGLMVESRERCYHRVLAIYVCRPQAAVVAGVRD